jgi:hypothetical protein
VCRRDSEGDGRRITPVLPNAIEWLAGAETDLPGCGVACQRTREGEPPGTGSAIRILKNFVGDERTDTHSASDLRLRK